MPKLRITTLSPLHIGSGDSYELHYNMLYQEGFVYLYDEFKIVEFFIQRQQNIPSNIDELKRLIQRFSNEIIASNTHIRKISSSFSQVNKPLLAHVATQNQVIVTGSSIKGAIRTAYVHKMVQDKVFQNEQKKLEELDDNLYSEQDFNKQNELKKEKNNLIKHINEKIVRQTKVIFRELKISDSFTNLQTQVFKSINIKKEKSHQSKRKEKVQQIANFIEGLQSNQTFEVHITISDDYFREIKKVCHNFYREIFNKEFEHYFLDVKKFPNLTVNEAHFFLNIGSFGGAELKSIEEIRSLPRTGAEVDFLTSARTYALEKFAKDEIYYDKELLPFGWVLCEVI
jgi:CRISPR-associated protein Csm5